VTEPPFWITTLVLLGVGALYLLITTSNAGILEDRNNETQRLAEQCTSFCEAHGYHFYEDRREALCYCGTVDSEETAFIVDVETSENWTVETVVPNISE